MCNTVLPDTHIKTVLFSLLFELELQRIVILNLVMLMKALPDDSNQANSIKLFNNYLDLLIK